MRKAGNQGKPNIGMCVSGVPLASILHCCGVLGGFNRSLPFSVFVALWMSVWPILILNTFISTERKGGTLNPRRDGRRHVSYGIDYVIQVGQQESGGVRGMSMGMGKRCGLYGKRDLVNKLRGRSHVTLAETAVRLDRRSLPRNFQFPNLLEPPNCRNFQIRDFYKFIEPRLSKAEPKPGLSG
jgi:hypothetical protein